VILSLKDKRTTVEALKRSDLPCLASEGRRSRHAWRQPAYGGSVFGVNGPSFNSASLPSFGGLAGQQIGSRMFAASVSLDSGANQEEGDP
jgi:hypothetical protein